MTSLKTNLPLPASYKLDTNTNNLDAIIANAEVLVKYESETATGMQQALDNAQIYGKYSKGFKERLPVPIIQYLHRYFTLYTELYEYRKLYELYDGVPELTVYAEVKAYYAANALNANYAGFVAIKGLFADILAHNDSYFDNTALILQCIQSILVAGDATDNEVLQKATTVFTS